MTDTARHWVGVSAPIEWDGTDDSRWEIADALLDNTFWRVTPTKLPGCGPALGIHCQDEDEDGHIATIGFLLPFWRIQIVGDSIVILPPEVTS